MKRAMSWILPGAAIFMLDRIVKIMCRDVNRVLLPGVLALHSAENTGMALGLFQGSALPVLLLSALLVGACLFLLRDVRVRGLGRAAISMMAGGALGNALDRLLLGYVQDMFELLFMDFYIFNVADVGVTVGAALCAVSLLFRAKDWSKR